MKIFDIESNKHVDNPFIDEVNELKELKRKYNNSALIMLATIPFIVMDYKNGIYDTTNCMNEQSINYEVNLKYYQFVCGINETILIIQYFIIVSSMHNNLDKIRCEIVESCFGILLNIWMVIWNIQGIIVYFGTVYGICDYDQRVYLTISFVVKILLNILDAHERRKEFLRS